LNRKLSQIDLLKDSLLPFLLIVDLDGTIISSGKAINKVAGKQLESQKIEDVVDFIFPSSFQFLCSLKKKSFVKFSLKNRDFVLKGDFKLFKKEGFIVLTSTPIFNSVFTLKDSNLNLNDFPENSIMAEYLFLVESNQRAISEAFRLVESVKQKNKSLTIVNLFAVKIQQAKTIDEVLWIVAKNAVAELGYYDCVIYMFDENRDYLVQKASHGPKNPDELLVLNPIKIKNGDGIVGGIARSGVAEIISDTSLDKRYIVDDEYRFSEITVPIIHDDEVIGIIDSEHPDKDFFSKKDLELLKTIASIAATKIVQTEFFDELSKNKENLEFLVDERTNELNNAFFDLEKKNAEIKVQNDSLEKMALFPEHNPNPVLELDFDFNLIYANESAINVFRIPSIFKEKPEEVEKIKRLLKATIKGKLTGKYNIKAGFYFENRKFDLNIYVDNKMEYIRLYFNDITENTKLQNNLKEQNESIVDSLNYSRRIQQSILPDLVQLKDTFEDYFLLYHPKDIVSGDFYWTHEQDGKVLFALNDCTGHGVPGALMSIIGYNTLNSIISSFDLSDVSDIVNGLNRCYFDLRKNSSNDLRDTMDVMILCFDKEQMCLKFSGSKQRFYIIRDNELQVYIADSYTLGFMEENLFSSGTITVKKGDVIYLFTDGYIDQFGGDRGKKFKYTRFRELLLSIHQLPMAEQKTILEDTMSNWMKGESFHHEQIDDISVVGFKV
jgi:serine phosphatase RsbU (regulator of sigma subunit)/putative methionine-R-sulfoxide reductase with GAF domain